MPSRLNNPLAKLRARSDKTNAALIRALEQAKKDIAGDIARIAARKDIATSAKTREELYAEVAARFKTLSDGIDAQLKELIEGVAKDTHTQAVAEVEAKGAEVVIRYDPARTKRYFDLVRPGNGKNLAAVFTENMSAEAVRQLRTAFVDVFRQGAVQGMTANDMQKALQQQWNEKAGDTNAFRFRDRAGRAWDNASYLQMLVRTNAQRVSIDAYTDTLTESGFNLAKISEDGDPDCPVCAAWEGRIIQLSGKSRKFPTLEDARAAGMFHPNCTHHPEYVDELFDADEIARQSKAGKPTPAQMADRKAMQEQKDEIDRSRYTDKGLTPKDADRAVTADRLERLIRAGTFSEDAAAAARSLPPEALDAIRKGGLPSFATAKKGETTGWRKGSAGGVVRVPQNATAKDVLDALVAAPGKPSEQQKPAKPILKPEAKPEVKTEEKPSAKKPEEKVVESVKTQKMRDELAAMKSKTEQARLAMQDAEARRDAAQKQAEELKKQIVAQRRAGLQASIKAAGLSPEIAKAADAIPDAVLEKALPPSIHRSAKQEAHYIPHKHEITISGKADEHWGSGNAFLHEYGHALHTALGVAGQNQFGGIIYAQGLKDATAGDETSWKAHLKSVIGDDWKKKFSNTKNNTDMLRSFESIMKAGGYGESWSQSDLAAKQRALCFSDTVNGLSSGVYGFGHTKAYARKLGRMEAFANCYVAAVRGWPEFDVAFPGLMRYVKSELGI